MEFVPEIADAFGRRKISKQLRRVRGSTLWENSWKVIAGKGLPAVSFQQNVQSKTVDREEIFFKAILTNHVKQFPVLMFCGSFWKSRRESLSSWRSAVVPWTGVISYYLTRWKLHRVQLSNQSQLLRWFETDIFGFATEFCQVLWLWNLEKQRNWKEHKDEADEKTAGWPRGSSSYRYSWKQHLAKSLFQCWGVYQQSGKIEFKWTLCAQILHNTFKEGSCEYTGVLQFEKHRYEDFPDKIMESPAFETFLTRRMRMLSRSDGFMLYGKLHACWLFLHFWIGVSKYENYFKTYRGHN